MLVPGRLYRLNEPTIAIAHGPNGHRTAIQLPARSVLQLVELDPTQKMATIEWDTRTCSIFIVDLQDRGQEVVTLREERFSPHADQD